MTQPMLGVLARILILLFVALGSTPIYAAPKEWTVLIFMNGKNNLEPFAIDDVAEIARVGSSDQVDFVVQMGRPARRPGEQIKMRKIQGGWSGVRRFHVTKGSSVGPGEEVEVVGDAAVDMGNKDVLTKFLAWGKARYPARNYAVVIWNHGQGYRLTFDAAGNALSTPEPRQPGDTSLLPSHRAVSQDADTGSIIYNADLRDAIAANFGAELRVIGFDACLMAMIETAYELRGLAPHLVASEELEPGPGWNYTSIATALTEKPTANGEELARMIVASYRETYGDNDSTTLSAIDLTKVAALSGELSKLADLLLKDRHTFFPVVQATREKRASYNTPVNPVSIDLIGFLQTLDANVASVPNTAALRAQIATTIVAARIAVVENYFSVLRDESEGFGSNGLAIYFPKNVDAFNADAWSDGYVRSNPFKPISFVTTEHWSAFLATYLGLPN